MVDSIVTTTESISDRWEPRLKKIISDATLEVVDRYSVTGNYQLFDQFNQTIKDAIMAMWLDSIKESGSVIVESFKDGFQFERKEEESVYDRILQLYHDIYGGDKISLITETTKNQIISLIEYGQQEGLSLYDIAKSMREAIPDLSALRAHVIARTETHSAAQFSSNEVAKLSRIKLMKVWNSTEDRRTRDFGEGDGVIDAFSHRAINGQTVGLDDMFTVPMRGGGSEQLAFPGDPRGSAGNIIMCRCVQTYERVRNA